MSADHAEIPSQGTVAMRIKKLAGEAGVARLDRMAKPVNAPVPTTPVQTTTEQFTALKLKTTPKQTTTEQATVEEPDVEVDSAETPSQGTVVNRIKKIAGDEGVARVDRMAKPVTTSVPTTPVQTAPVQLKPVTTPLATSPEQTTTVQFAEVKLKATPKQTTTEQSNVAEVNITEQAIVHTQAQPVVEESSLEVVEKELVFTPREGAETTAQAARPALRMSMPAEARRNSRVSFARDFCLEVDSESEVDIGVNSDDEDDDADNKPAESKVISSFALDGDSEDSGSDDDFDDEYDFDHDKLAELVKTGADRMQLASVVEEAMASALERKLARKAGKEPLEMSELAAAASANAGDWDLDGRMTPGQMTPTDDAAAGPAVDDVAERAKEALALANARRRRSSAARKQLPHIAQAMEEAKERRRKSLARKLNSNENSQDKITAAMEQARGRHRKSISKAADVLECAGYDEDSGVPCSEAAAKMRLVQQAMEDARLRHRRSIARAVQHLDAPPALVVPSLSAEVPEFSPCAEVRQSSWNQVAAQQPVWASESANTWTCPSSSVQTRIDQAVSSAYNTHCYQQGYGEQDWTQCGASNQQVYQPQGCASNQQVYQQQGCGDYGYAQQGQTQVPYEQQQCYDQQYGSQQYGQGQASQGFVQQGSQQYGQGQAGQGFAQQGYVQQMGQPATYIQDSSNQGYTQGCQQEVVYGQQSCNASYQQDTSYSQNYQHQQQQPCQQVYQQEGAFAKESCYQGFQQDGGYGQQNCYQQGYQQESMYGQQSW